MNDKTKWENAHFEHDSHPVDGSMSKPAAAQEAVTWLSKDDAQLALFQAIQAIKLGNPTDDKMILANLREAGLWIGRYAAAPFAAAPTAPLKVFSKGLWIFRETGQEFSGADLDEAAFTEYRQFSTPAAPGIDLREFGVALIYAVDVLRSASRIANAKAADKLERLIELIDASPKGGIHPDDAAVDAFAAEMKAKLAKAREKGRGGWQGGEPGMQQRLSDMLREHVEKGDPRDVANFCMFLHQRGEGISPKGGSTHSPGHNWCWECGRRPSDPLAFNCQARDFHMPATSAEVGE